MIELAMFLFLGFLGAVSRILIQIWRDKEITQTGPEVLCEILLGVIAGYLTYMLVVYYGWTNHLTAFCAGFAAPDIIENIYRHYAPKFEE